MVTIQQMALLAYLAGLEQSANHPIADGILAQAKEKMFSRSGWNQAHSGIGIEGMIAQNGRSSIKRDRKVSDNRDRTIE